MAEHNVISIVVGGHAVQFHGHLRPAKDLDVFFSTEGDNPSKLQSALVAARVPVAQIPIASLSSPTAQVRVNGWYNTELLGHIAGVSFEDAYSGAISESERNANAGVSVISLAHLIQNKRTLKSIKCLLKRHNRFFSTSLAFSFSMTTILLVKTVFCCMA